MTLGPLTASLKWRDFDGTWLTVRSYPGPGVTVILQCWHPAICFWWTWKETYRIYISVRLQRQLPKYLKRWTIDAHMVQRVSWEREQV